MHIREIRAKINSTSQTRKITRAMEMMARTKMAGAQRRARIFRPYAERTRSIVLRVYRDKPDCLSAFLAKRNAVKHIGLIVVSTDRGLCGSLNTRLLLLCVESLQKWQESEITAEISVIGTRASAPLQRHGANIVARTSTLTSNFESFFGTITVSLSSFLSGKLDEVYVAYNHLSGALSYEPRVEKVLPLGDLLSDNLEAPLPEYLYEPDPKSVVDTLALRYVEAFIYQAVAENNACEQCARMFAMHAATENADRMLRDLKHLYQKTRQAQITTELCEIVAGAAAV